MNEEKKTICCPYYLYFRGISAAMTQRIINLAQNYNLILLLRDDITIPEEIMNSEAVIYRRAYRNDGIRLFYYKMASTISLFKIYRRHKFDAIYCMHYYYILRSLLMKWIFNVKWIIDILDDPGLRMKDYNRRKDKLWIISFINLMHNNLVRFSLRFADLVVTIGERKDEGLPKILLEDYHIKNNKMVYVTNGIDLGKVLPKGLKPNSSEFLVFYVGYVGIRSGMETVLRAIKILVDKIPNIKLVLIGHAKKHDRARLFETIDSLGLQPYVDYRGERENEEVLNWIERADVCLYPFLDLPENACVYPIKVFEYLSLHKAVVASNLTGVRAIIQDNFNGKLVEPSNHQEFAEAVWEIYANRDLRETLEKNSRSSIEKFDIKYINKKINYHIDALLTG